MGSVTLVMERGDVQTTEHTMLTSHDHLGSKDELELIGIRYLGGGAYWHADR